MIFTKQQKNGKIHYRKIILIGLFLFMTLYRSFIFVGFRGTNCPSIGFHPIAPCEWFNVPFELMLWTVVLFLFVIELIWSKEFKSFLIVCKRNWLVFVFVLVAVLSTLWSVLPQITLYKVYVLFICTSLAFYFGNYLGISRFLNTLFCFITIISIINLIFIQIFPQASKWGGINLWNGMFWHKIYMGSFMALAATIYILQLLEWKKSSRIERIINIIMLFCSIFLVMKSGSVTGFITTAVMAALCLTIIGWIHWGNYFKPVHYYLLLGIVIFTIVLICLNLGNIFQLLGRNPNLSGRIPMWIYIFQHAVIHRPILGYGYGAFWNLDGFRNQMTEAMGFSLEVSQSDNSFMEILLHLGSIGLVLLFILIAISFIRGINYLRLNRTPSAALPLILLIYALIVNTTVSMLLETDSFIWTILVASQAAIWVPISRIRKENYLESILK